jgi:hypothetical protein
VYTLTYILVSLINNSPGTKDYRLSSMGIVT